MVSICTPMEKIEDLVMGMWIPMALRSVPWYRIYICNGLASNTHDTMQ